MSEKTKEQIADLLDAKFQESGYAIREDILELLESEPGLVNKINSMKFHKIKFFESREDQSVGFTLEDVQVEFFVATGVDAEGPWYEAEVEIRSFEGEDED